MDEIGRYFAALLGALMNVPAPFWSALAGGLLALGGVFIANRSNTKRLTLQLTHDAQQKDKDRLATLRREVFLQLPKGASKAVSSLSKMAIIRPKEPFDTSAMEEFGAVSSQLSIIASLRTVRAVNAFGAGLALCQMESLKELEELQGVSIDLELKEDRINEVNSDIDRIFKEMQIMSEAGKLSAERYDFMGYWLNARRSESARLMEEVSELRDRKLALDLEYQKSYLAKMPRIRTLSLAAMQEIRREIGLVDDADEFSRVMSEATDGVLIKAQKLMEEWSEEDVSRNSGLPS
jgi:predicted SpoU family rRNA methylase